MDFGFTPQETLFIYGHLRKQISKLEKLKADPTCSIEVESIDQDIDLYSGIADKIENLYPNLNGIKRYL